MTNNFKDIPSIIKEPGAYLNLTIEKLRPILFYLILGDMVQEKLFDLKKSISEPREGEEELIVRWDDIMRERGLIE